MKGSVLIIDDEDKLRILLSRIIGLEGYAVIEAATVKDGLKKLEKEEINVVVTDVKLPDGNGVELTQKIKSLFPHIEVIVITAYGTIADGVKAIKNGAFDYIVKSETAFLRLQKIITSIFSYKKMEKTLNWYMKMM